VPPSAIFRFGQAVDAFRG